MTRAGRRARGDWGAVQTGTLLETCPVTFAGDGTCSRALGRPGKRALRRLATSGRADGISPYKYAQGESSLEPGTYALARAQSVP